MIPLQHEPGTTTHIDLGHDPTIKALARLELWHNHEPDIVAAEYDPITGVLTLHFSHALTQAHLLALHTAIERELDSLAEASELLAALLFSGVADDAIKTILARIQLVKGTPNVG